MCLLIKTRKYEEKYTFESFYYFVTLFYKKTHRQFSITSPFDVFILRGKTELSILVHRFMRTIYQSNITIILRFSNVYIGDAVYSNCRT